MSPNTISLKGGSTTTLGIISLALGILGIAGQILHAVTSGERPDPTVTGGCIAAISTGAGLVKAADSKQ